MRSVLATAVLAAALTATGAATATAGDGDGDGQRYPFNGGHACSPYHGEIEMETAEVEWGGARCDGRF
ncbi:hypothetical protein [Streptomyces sp. NPDC006997]|uniref:hypothetical protein n=1 Tax=Streptomyces sp. NPDC006997 TaxID=3155356 RepID=UPI0033D77715